MSTDSLTDTSALAPEGAARRARKEARRNQLLRAAGAVLDELTERVPAAVAAADEDPVERVSAAFTMYCRVIDENRQATLITYRGSKSLTAANRTHIKSHEVESLRPLVEAIQEAVRSGAFVELDVELLAYDLVLLAHGWDAEVVVLRAAAHVRFLRPGPAPPGPGRRRGARAPSRPRTGLKPVIATVNGLAIGGGHVLHVPCDLTIAASTARFGQSGPKVGSY